jgi:hypothetical protein
VATLYRTTKRILDHQMDLAFAEVPTDRGARVVVHLPTGDRVYRPSS